MTKTNRNKTNKNKGNKTNKNKRNKTNKNKNNRNKSIQSITYSPTINVKYKKNNYIKLSKTLSIPNNLDDDCMKLEMYIPKKDKCYAYNSIITKKYLMNILFYFCHETIYI